MTKIYIAPMAGVTDYTFREILHEFQPDLIFTEMVSVNAMKMANYHTVTNLLKLHKNDGVQIFGNDPKLMVESAVYLEKIGVKNIDINCGCPMKKIVQNGYGAALMSMPDLINRILGEIKSSLKNDTKLSLKIRCGYKGSNNYLEIGKIAEKNECSHITIHGRTREEMYTGIADWEKIKILKENLKIPVIGNGDIFDAVDAKKKIEYSKVDGIMLARGILGNPYLIRDIKNILVGKKIEKVSDIDKINMAIYHTQKMIKNSQSRKYAFELRKHLCWYLKGIKNSAEIKNEINHLDNYDAVIDILENFKKEITNS